MLRAEAIDFYLPDEMFRTSSEFLTGSFKNIQLSPVEYCCDYWYRVSIITCNKEKALNLDEESFKQALHVMTANNFQVLRLFVPFDFTQHAFFLSRAENQRD